MQRPWRLRFAEEDVGWTPAVDVMRVLMAADEDGAPVLREKASAILKALHTHGYVERYAQSYRVALPSLASHFKILRDEMDLDSELAESHQENESRAHWQHDTGGVILRFGRRGQRVGRQTLRRSKPMLSAEHRMGVIVLLHGSSTDD